MMACWNEGTNLRLWLDILSPSTSERDEEQLIPIDQESLINMDAAPSVTGL
jgi:hypothetical protein